MSYEGPLLRARAKTAKVDITIRELLVFPVEERPILRGYDEYHDLPEAALLHVYSLDEIAAEKTVALLDRARNEPRHLYDLWYLISSGQVRVPDLVGAIESKLEFRGLTLDQVSDQFDAKEARYRKLWRVRLEAQMARLPEFHQVRRAVRRAFRQSGIFKR